MPDHKFRQHADRNYVLLDAKQRIIDLMENGQELPEVGIYDTPVRYFKANEEWCKIIFGWLDWLEDVAGWKDAEDDNYSGIQQILIFEEGIEMPEPSELYLAIKSGIYDAVNDVAKQIVSGRVTNITVGDDGTVTDPTDGMPETPVEDDPATEINEARSAAAGGAIAVRLGFNEIWSIVSAMWTASASSQAACTTRLLDTFVWVSDAECGAFVNDYYAARTAAASWVAAFTTILDSRMYCKGVTKQALNDWIYDTFTGSQLDMALDLSRAIDQEQMNTWYNFGIQTPSTAYITYSCTPAEIEEFILDMSTANIVQYTTNAVYKTSHRLLIEVSGSFVDADVANTVQDFFYEVNTVTGIKTFLPSFFQINGAGITEPSQAQVPYQPSHSYAVTVDIPSTSSGTIIFGRDNDAYAVPNITGILSFKVTDLGEYAL